MRLRVFVQDAVSGTSFAIEGEGKSAQDVVDGYNRALKEGEPKITAVTAVQLDAEEVPVEVVGEPDEEPEEF